MNLECREVARRNCEGLLEVATSAFSFSSFSFPVAAASPRRCAARAAASACLRVCWRTCAPMAARAYRRGERTRARAPWTDDGPRTRPPPEVSIERLGRVAETLGARLERGVGDVDLQDRRRPPEVGWFAPARSAGSRERVAPRRSRRTRGRDARVLQRRGAKCVTPLGAEQKVSSLLVPPKRNAEKTTFNDRSSARSREKTCKMRDIDVLFIPDGTPRCAWR